MLKLAESLGLCGRRTCDFRQGKLSLTGGKGNVSLLYREDDYFSYLEIYQHGIARDDDNFISSLVLTGPPASFR